MDVVTIVWLFPTILRNAKVHFRADIVVESTIAFFINPCQIPKLNNKKKDPQHPEMYPNPFQHLQTQKYRY